MGKLNDDYKVGSLIYEANIYDAMNSNLDDLNFYKRWLPRQKSSKVLELCCGTGRLTITISKAGHNICGIDFTKSMLEEARLKANKEGVDIHFIQADVRTFDLGETFDLIFIPFNSVHHFYKTSDLIKVLRSVKTHLKDSGILLFDCFNPNIKFMVAGENIEKKIAEYTTKEGRKIEIREKMKYESDTQINRIEWYFYINGKFDSVQNLDMRMFFPQELDYLLKSNGFHIIHKFGDFDEKVFHADSDKQIFVCK